MFDAAAYKRKWAEENKDSIKEQKKSYYARNRESILARLKIKRDAARDNYANPEKVIEAYPKVNKRKGPYYTYNVKCKGCKLVLLIQKCYDDSYTHCHFCGAKLPANLRSIETLEPAEVTKRNQLHHVITEDKS